MGIEEEIKQRQEDGMGLTPRMQDYLIDKKRFEADQRLLRYIRGAMVVGGCVSIGFILGQILLELF